MDINRIITIGGDNDKETLNMILSYNADMGSSNGCLISIKAFPKLINDLIMWKNFLLEESEIQLSTKVNNAYKIEDNDL